MTCRTHEIDLSALLDGELSAVEERSLRDHLSGCALCRARLDAYRTLSAKLSACAPDVAESPGFVDRVVGSAASGRKPRAAGNGSRPNVIRGRFPPLTLSLSAAAALLLLATLSIFWLASNTSPVDRNPTVALSDLAEYRIRAGSVEPGDAAAHLALADWCKERGLADLAARETFRAFGADPQSDAAKSGVAELLLDPTVGIARLDIRAPDLGDLGGPLPDPAPRRRALTRDEVFARLGLSKDEAWGQWLNDEARARLRDQRELSRMLADAERRNLRMADAIRGVKGNPVATLLVSLEPGKTRTHGNLTIVALLNGTGDQGVEPLGVAEAMKAGVLEIREGSDGLYAVNNHPSRPVFFAAGTVLVGGRQDRVIRRPSLISAKTGPEELPTLCCEKNRSWGPTDVFALSPGVAPVGIRHLLMGAMDNEPIWNRIAGQLSHLKAGYGKNGSDGSLRSVFNRGKGAAAQAEYGRALLAALDQRRAVGFLVFRGDKLLGGDVFTSHELLTRLAPRFLAGYVLDSFWEEDGRAVTGGRPAAEKVLLSVTKATWFHRRGAVSGREYEFLGAKNGPSGIALVPVAGARPLHISIFPHRRPKALPGAEAPASGGSSTPTTSGSGSTSAPPDDDRGTSDGKADLEERRRRRNERRQPREIKPPKDGGPRVGGGGSNGGGGKKIGGGSTGGGSKRDPRLPE
jgi:anti-sigma factor RsiW